MVLSIGNIHFVHVHGQCKIAVNNNWTIEQTNVTGWWDFSLDEFPWTWKWRSGYTVGAMFI